MNSDMVHPRARGGDLLGYLFVDAFRRAYLGEKPRQLAFALSEIDKPRQLAFALSEIR